MKVPMTFSNNVFTQPALFAERLRRKSDPVSVWLWTQLDEDAQILVRDFQSAFSDQEHFQRLMSENLNRVITSRNIYKEEIFRDVAMRPETKALIAKNPVGEEVILLNRRLLEDGYPRELSRDYEFDFLKQEFDKQALRWAYDAFQQEIETNFQRARAFDSLYSSRCIQLLANRPKEDLKVLADVLPRGVLYDNAVGLARRNSLSPEQKATVERLRADLKHDDRRRTDGQFSKMYHKEVKNEFNLAARVGNRVMKDYADRSEYEFSTGARGEWNLRILNDDFIYCISIKLARYMILDYFIGVSMSEISRRIRFRDNYLGMLGFAKGEWVIESAGQFDIKLMKAIEFALWHRGEYEKILMEIVK